MNPNESPSFDRLHEPPQPVEPSPVAQPPQTHSKDRWGRSIFARGLAAARRLQAHGVQPDLLCTVTSAAAKESVSVYRALRNTGSGWLQFIPILERGPDGRITPESVTPEAYGRFLCTVFDQSVHHDPGKLTVQLFAETSPVWAGGSANVCWMAPTCGRVGP